MGESGEGIRTPERLPDSGLTQFVLRMLQEERGVTRDNIDPEFIEQVNRIHISDAWLKLIENHKGDINNWTSGLLDIQEQVTRDSGYYEPGEFEDPTQGARLIAGNILNTPELETDIFLLLDLVDTSESAEAVVSLLVENIYGSEPEGSKQWLKDGIRLMQSFEPGNTGSLNNDPRLLDDFKEEMRILFSQIHLSPKWRLVPMLLEQNEDAFNSDRGARHMMGIIAKTAIANLRREQIWGIQGEMPPEKRLESVKENLQNLLAHSFPEFILGQTPSNQGSK